MSSGHLCYLSFSIQYRWWRQFLRYQCHNKLVKSYSVLLTGWSTCRCLSTIGWRCCNAVSGWLTPEHHRLRLAEYYATESSSQLLPWLPLSYNTINVLIALSNLRTVKMIFSSNSLYFPSNCISPLQEHAWYNINITNYNNRKFLS